MYIETTVPSCYCDTRPELTAAIARTRQWWDQEREDYEPFISPVVLDELGSGAYPYKDECLALVASLPILAVTPEVLEIADVYQAKKLVPKHPVADAVHLAVASYYRMDYLLTWNCRHLANVNKLRHLEVLNERLGLHVPLLVTPEMLQPWEA